MPPLPHSQAPPLLKSRKYTVSVVWVYFAQVWIAFPVRMGCVKPYNQLYDIIVCYNKLAHVVSYQY